MTALILLPIPNGTDDLSCGAGHKQSRNQTCQHHSQANKGMMTCSHNLCCSKMSIAYNAPLASPQSARQPQPCSVFKKISLTETTAMIAGWRRSWILRKSHPPRYVTETAPNVPSLCVTDWLLLVASLA
jgi:hypothetical protein